MAASTAKSKYIRRSYALYELYEHGKLIGTGTMKQLSHIAGVCETNLRIYLAHPEKSKTWMVERYKLTPFIISDQVFCPECQSEGQHDENRDETVLITCEHCGTIYKHAYPIKKVAE